MTIGLGLIPQLRDTNERKRKCLEYMGRLERDTMKRGIAWRNPLGIHKSASVLMLKGIKFFYFLSWFPYPDVIMSLWLVITMFLLTTLHTKVSKTFLTLILKYQHFFHSCRVFFTIKHKNIGYNWIDSPFLLD